MYILVNRCLLTEKNIILHLDMAYHCEDDYLREVRGTLGIVLFTWTCGENQTYPRL